MNQYLDNNQSNDIEYDYIIFHKNCLDGFTGFFIYMKCLMSQNKSKIPFIYSDFPHAKEIPPNIKNKKILIIDVAYKKEILEKIISQAQYVTHIDHHITIKNDVYDLLIKYKNKFHSVYDNNESGASLTWIFFKNKTECFNESMPKFIKYIRDNDIGTWKLKNTMAFITALRVHYSLEPVYDNIKKWDNLFDNSKIKHLIQRGKMYLKYDNYLLNQNFKMYSLEQFPSKHIFNEFKNSFSEPGQYKVAVINGSGCPSSSILGKKIVDEVDCDFCIMWTLHMVKKEFIISFRSKKTNVGKIAQLFGGGGHEFASACSIPISKYNITDLFFPYSISKR